MAKTAVIIGGSLAGLMNGIMLRHQGYTVTILEQDPATSQRRSQAAGIALGSDFLKFIEKYDRTGRAFSDGNFPMYICAKNGSTARKLPVSFHYSNWGLLNSILRANFDCCVSEACPIPPEPIAGPGKSIYLSGKRVTEIRFISEKVLVHFQDVSNQNYGEIVSDLVIAADGSSSTIRNIICPQVKRRYSGYVSWRGTVPESQVTIATGNYFDGCAKFFRHMPKSYMLVYKIPSDDGNISPGGRFINWVWYYNMPETSQDLRDAMTDINGKEHFNTVPRDLLQPCVWKKQKAIGLTHVPPPFAEMLEQTKTTFVSRVNDVQSSEAVVNDRLFFVGDALNTLRPHIAQGANQAAFHCGMLEEVIKGHLKPKDWKDKVMRQSQMTAAISTMVGMYGLRKWSAFARAVIKVLTLVIVLKLKGVLDRIMGRGQAGIMTYEQSK